MALMGRKGAYVEEKEGEVVMMVAARAREWEGEGRRGDDGQQQQGRRSSSAGLPLVDFKQADGLFWLLGP